MSYIQAKSRLRSSSVSSIMPTIQARQFWRFNKPDYASHLDPHYHRFHRQRNLATRAKLIRSIRRGKKWDLGGEHELFFSPRHARLASHYNGAGGHKKWRRDTEQQGREEQKDNDDYELSTREKAWKEHMERIRKRVDVDPYEAIFGRRFQPFWAPLMPSWVPDNAAESVASKEVKQPEQKPGSSSYAYSRSTSWDSWTNTAKGTEWDSLSGETKHYEYDPITNRMVQIVKQQSVSADDKPAPAIENKRATPPSKPDSTSQRKAIPIPQFASPETASNIDEITASSIRASMGKPKSQDHHQILALLQESAPKKTASSSWDHAEQCCMLEGELQTLQAKKNRLVQEQQRTFHYGDLARRHEQLDTQMRAIKSKLQVLNDEQITMAKASVSTVKPLTTALQRGATASKKVTEAPLRPALERMQSKPAPDMDDSAAHESTGATTATVPRAWAEQANLLQNDRVKRTSSKVAYPSPVPKWVDDMAAREEAAANDTAAHERAAKLAKTDALLHAEVSQQKQLMELQEERRASAAMAKAQRSVVDERESARAIVEAEHGDNSASVESKYKAKLAAMKEELDLAYQQSSRHADEFRSQISKASLRGETGQDIEKKYKAKLAALRENLDIAYKQSAKHADEFNKQIQQLSDQLKRANLGVSATATTSANKAQPEQTLREQALVKEIRGIYEQAYGVIGQENRSTPAMKDALAGFDKMTARDGNYKSQSHPTGPVKEISNAYAFKNDNLETELAPSAPLAKATNNVYDFQDDGLEQELASSPQSAKVLNRKQDTLEKELARFATSAQDSGMCARPMKDHPSTVSTKNSAYSFRHDNLEAELSSKAASTNHDLPDLDAKSYQFKDDNLEAELAQRQRTKRAQFAPWRHRLNELKEVSKMVHEVKHGRPVNPIDGTVAPVTGNYASPTGFVNFDDPVDYSRRETPSSRSHPRIKREEAVFTGTRRVHGHHDMSASGVRRARRRQRRARRVMRTTGAIILLSLGGAYVYGTQLENSEMKRLGGQEAWAKMAQQYEQRGEPGIAEAIKDMKQTDSKWSSGLFWK